MWYNKGTSKKWVYPEKGAHHEQNKVEKKIRNTERL